MAIPISQATRQLMSIQAALEGNTVFYTTHTVSAVTLHTVRPMLVHTHTVHGAHTTAMITCAKGLHFGMFHFHPVTFNCTCCFFSYQLLGTALDLASCCGHLQVVRLLTGRGSELNGRDTEVRVWQDLMP